MWQVTSVICSLDMPWDQLPHYVFKLQCQVNMVRSDRFCFLHAVCKLLYMDHDEMVTLDNMESSILDYLASSVNYYKLFHTGHVLKDAQRYFKFGTYYENVFNLIVVARERALNLNLTIYQKGWKETHKFSGILQMQWQKKLTWNLHVALIMWLTTTMKPYCSLINLQRAIQKRRLP